MGGKPVPLTVETGIEGVIGDQTRFGMNPAYPSETDIVREGKGISRRTERTQRVEQRLVPPGNFKNRPFGRQHIGESGKRGFQALGVSGCLGISVQRGFCVGEDLLHHIPPHRQQLFASLEVPAGHLAAHLIAQLDPFLLDELIGVAQDILLGAQETLGFKFLHLPVDFIPLFLRILGDSLHKFADFFIAVRHTFHAFLWADDRFRS